MSLRLKLVTAMVALAALSTLFIGVFAFRSTSVQLRTQIDRSLLEATERVGARPAAATGGGREGDPRDLARFRAPSDVIVQFLTQNGRVIVTPETAGSGIELPVSESDLRIARSDLALSQVREVQIDGEPFLMLTTGADGGPGAIQTARSLAETQRVTDELSRRILVAGALSVLIAGALGWVIADQVTRRLVRLTDAAERVAATRDLSVEVPVDGTDEAGRLGAAFSQMLGALARSKEDQQRLVQDAGHELRTPLTSLRTNVFALRRSAELDPGQRDRLLDDLEGEAEELTRLIDEVVELATDRRSDEPVAPVDLAALVRRVAERSSQRSGRAVDVQAQECSVEGRPLALERAVGNLIENALKFDTGDAPIEVNCGGGTIEVADRGPGLDDADLPHIFDRFYRSAEARGRPGSGLGLAIVADVVERHGGTTHARNRDGGGAVVGFTLPTD